MWPIVRAYKPIAHGLSVGLCRSVTVVSPVKTAEPIEMPFGLWTHTGQRKHVLDGSPDKWAILGEWDAHCKIHVYGTLCRSCAKTAKPIKMPFGF